MEQGSISEAGPGRSLPAVELHEDVVVEVEEEVAHEEGEEVVGGVGGVVQGKVEAEREVCAAHHKQEDDPLQM